MSRPDIDTYFMQLAAVVATRSTCLRRSVGCILVNKRNHQMATGYNGVVAGAPHCNNIVQYISASWEDAAHAVHRFHNQGIHAHVDGTGSSRYVAYPNACAGAHAPSGVDLDRCEAIHAEQNALLQCRDVYAIRTCYVTTFPCVHCVKLLLGTSCERIVYGEEYAGGGSLELWDARQGRHSRVELKI